jgi:hypothetical protein
MLGLNALPGAPDSPGCFAFGNREYDRPALLDPRALDVLGWKSGVPASFGIDEQLSDYEPTKGRRIADMDAKCFASTHERDDPPTSEVEEFCFGDRGELLFARNYDGGLEQERAIEARAVDTELNDSSFTRPYPLVDLREFERVTSD